jgi:E3 ubiquitin-protein ligase TRIP12
MTPRLTVALRTADSGTPDEQLPSVMTCANYLKLPAYSCKEVMRRQLSTAIAWAQKGFMLT